jgi:hypothetical protein
MYIFTLAIYSVSYLLISDERLTEVDKRMNPARTPQGSYVAPLIVYPDTGESGEAYDLDPSDFSTVGALPPVEHGVDSRCH